MHRPKSLFNFIAWGSAGVATAATTLAFVMGGSAENKTVQTGIPQTSSCTEEFKQALKTPSRIQILNTLIDQIDRDDAVNHPFVQANAKSKSATAVKNQLLAGLLATYVAETSGKITTYDMTNLFVAEDNKLDPNSINPKSGAGGLGHLLPMTFLETFSKYGHLTSRPDLQSHAKAFMATHNEIKALKKLDKPIPLSLQKKHDELKEGNKKITDLRFNPRDAAMMAAQYTGFVADGTFVINRDYARWVLGKGLAKDLDGTKTKPAAERWPKQAEVHPEFFVEKRKVTETHVIKEPKQASKKGKSVKQKTPVKTKTVLVEKIFPVSDAEVLARVNDRASKSNNSQITAETINLVDRAVADHIKQLRKPAAAPCPSWKKPLDSGTLKNT